MHQHPLTVEIRPQGASVILAIAGELDLSSCGTLRVCLEELDPVYREVLVDLSAVSFVDSTGLAVLLTTQKALEARGGRLAVRGPCRHVRRVLEVSGVDQFLTVVA